MANAAVYVGEKVNGVAAIHSELVKRNLFPVAYKYYPDKFQNVTNGITQRRWLMLCNRELSALLDKKLTPAWREDMTRLEALSTSDTAEFIAVKAEKKKQLAEYILLHDGVKLLDLEMIGARMRALTHTSIASSYNSTW